MHRDYTKICRVCMSDGSRDIFHKAAATADGTGTAAAAKIATPLERLLEKLRYVTMMKIEDNDDLPRLLCDLCIVQLNVAYNFKRQAVENDTKLRQYFIENGISSNQAVPMNEISSVRSSFTASNISQRNQNFPIVPLIVKTEPHDIDAFSDVTTETNLDIDNRTNFQSVASNTASSPEEPHQRANDSIYSNDINPSSMVYVNRGYEFNSVTPSSDIEFVQNYQMSTTNDFHTVEKESENNSSKTSPSNKRTSTPMRRNISTQRSNGIKKMKSTTSDEKKSTSREARNLTIDMIPDAIKSSLSKEHRRLSGKTNRVLRDSTAAPVSSATATTSTIVARSSPVATIKTNNSPVPTKRLASLLPSSNSSATKQTSSKRNSNILSPPRKNAKPNTENLIVRNPFNSTKVTNKVKTQTTNKKLKSDSRVKRKSVEKLLRPKIEPPPTAKKN